MRRGPGFGSASGEREKKMDSRDRSFDSCLCPPSAREPSKGREWEPCVCTCVCKREIANVCIVHIGVFPFHHFHCVQHAACTH